MYKYQEIRPTLFTEAGQRTFLRIRDEAFRLNAIAGCFRADKVMIGVGDSWEMLACLDRMIELGDVVEITDKDSVSGQDRIFRRA